MAQLECGNCGHKQQAPETGVGAKAKCPNCGTVGRITTEMAEDKTVATRKSWRTLLGLARKLPRPSWASALPVVAILLLGCSVALQSLILLRLPVRSNAPVPVSITDVSTLDNLPVSIEDVGAFVRLPVSIDEISTSDELEIKLSNHYILRGDPIPVEIIR